MRFAIGGLMHETNTFTELMTPLEDFLIAEGEEMLSIPESVRDMPIQGIIEVCQAEKVEIVPTLLPSAAFGNYLSRCILGTQAENTGPHCCGRSSMPLC